MHTMKSRHHRVTLTWALAMLLAWNATHALAQTKYILPLGNSITLGKSNFQDPAQNAGDYTSHGYRGYLYQAVHNAIPGLTLEFTGPSSGDVSNIGVQPYRGWFQNGAVIADFHDAFDANPAGYRNAIAMLNGLVNKPDYVMMHVGTNDIGNIGLNESEALVGHFNSPGTIMYDLKVLMHQLLEWDSGSIEQIFLCKIVPRAPYAEFPGVNANIVDYNEKIDDLLNNDLEVLYPGRVTIVNMYSPVLCGSGDVLHGG